MHRNKANGKVYIGITCQKPEYRWNHGKGYENSQYFYNAIQKYGWDGFDHVILHSGLSEDEAKQLEIQTISTYDSTNAEYGYNISRGGDLGVTSPVYQYDFKTGSFIEKYADVASASQYTGISHRNIIQAANNHMKKAGDYYFTYHDYGQNLPQELLDEIHDYKNIRHIAQYDLNGNLISTYNSKVDAQKEIGKKISMNIKVAHGFIWRYYDKEPLSCIPKDELHTIFVYKNSIPINQYDLNGKYITTWDNARKVSAVLNISQPSIRQALSGNCTHAGGYLWKVFENDANIDIVPDETKRRILNKMIGVFQYDLSGKLLKEYDSIADASKELDIFAYCIKSVCKKDGTAYTAGGYIWRFIDDPLRQEELQEIFKKANKHSVVRIDEATGLTETFPSLRSVKKLGFAFKSVKECCEGIRESYKGFKWEYAD